MATRNNSDTTTPMELVAITYAVGIPQGVIYADCFDDGIGWQPRRPPRCCLHCHRHLKPSYRDHAYSICNRCKRKQVIKR